MLNSEQIKFLKCVRVWKIVFLTCILRQIDKIPRIDLRKEKRLLGKNINLRLILDRKRKGMEFWQSFSAQLSSFFFRSPEDQFRVWGENIYFFGKNVFFASILKIEQKNHFLTKIFWRVCRNCPLRLRENFWEKVLLDEIYNFFIIFGYWVKNFRHCAENFFSGVVKTSSCVSRENFSGRIFLLNNCWIIVEFSLSLLSDIERIIFWAFWRVFSDKAEKTAFGVSKGRFQILGKKCYWRKFTFLYFLGI